MPNIIYDVFLTYGVALPLFNHFNNFPITSNIFTSILHSFCTGKRYGDLSGLFMVICVASLLDDGEFVSGSGYTNFKYNALLNMYSKTLK